MRAASAVRRSVGFSLVELLVVIAVIVALVAILLPVLAKARASAMSVRCAANLHQIDAGLVQYVNQFKSLPVRPDLLDSTNPHVFRYQTWPESVAEQMETLAGDRRVLYCPASGLREQEEWWPYTSGTIAGTYQYPFWLNELMWTVPKPDYKHPQADQVIAADRLGVLLLANATIKVVAWNHEIVSDGSPRGMNMLYADHHVDWHPTERGWQLYGYGFGNIYWYLGQ